MVDRSDMDGLFGRRRAPPKRQRVIEISDDDDDDIEPVPIKRQKQSLKEQVIASRERQISSSSENPETVSETDSDSSDDVILSNQPFLRDDSVSSNVDYSRFKQDEPAEPVPAPAGWDTSQIQASQADIDRTRHIRMEECPFYQSDRWGIRLYRGPDFEDFHIAVGTLDGITELCDEWVRKDEESRRDVQPLPQLPRQESKFTQAQDQCVAKVLEVFPDVDHDYVRLLLSDVIAKYGDLQSTELSANQILDEILKRPDYPKASKERDTKKVKFEPAKDGTGVTIPVRDDMRNRPTYHKTAVIILAWEFLHIPTVTIEKGLRDKNTIYDAYMELTSMEEKYYSGPKLYRMKKEPRETIEKKYELQEACDDIGLPFWLNEVQAAKQFLEREDIKKRRRLSDAANEVVNLEYHRQEQLLVTCFICYDEEIPVNRAVFCEGDTVHFYCYTCVDELAKTRIGLMKHEMQCCDPGDASGQCKAELDRKGLEEALSKRTLARLDLNKQTAEIRAADLDGLEQCPYCDYKQIFDDGDESVVFQCLNPDCARASCRTCHEEAHIPKSCEEMEKDRGLSARHAVEEARSESIMRKCPKCKVKILKELGCNKMQCVQCHIYWCYICQVDITRVGYDHFHNKNSKCPLYDQGTNEMHQNEADAAEQEAIRRVVAQNADINAEDLRIETGKEKTAPRQPVPPQQHGFLANAQAQQQALRAQQAAMIQQQQAQAALQRDMQHQQQLRMPNVHNGNRYHLGAEEPPGAFPGGNGMNLDGALEQVFHAPAGQAGGFGPVQPVAIGMPLQPQPAYANDQRELLALRMARNARQEADGARREATVQLGRAQHHAFQPPQPLNAANLGQLANQQHGQGNQAVGYFARIQHLIGRR